MNYPISICKIHATITDGMTFKCMIQLYNIGLYWQSTISLATVSTMKKIAVSKEIRNHVLPGYMNSIAIFV